MILVVGQNSVWQKLCLLSRLERGEVNRVSRVREYASGKGVNVARAVSCLTGEALVLGYAGGARGKLFAEDCGREGIRGDWTRIGEETRLCTTLAEEDGLSTEVIEPTPRVSAGERGRFLRTFLRRMDGARMLIISGTTVEGESEDCYAVYVREARRRSIPVILDSACTAAQGALSERPDILKINVRELALLSGRKPEGADGRRRMCAEIAEKHGIRWIAVTDGPRGMEGWDGRAYFHASPPPVKPVKTIGGGDAAAAGMAVSVLEQAESAAGLPAGTAFREALTTATAAGTASCLSAVGGRIERSDYNAVKKGVTVQELPSS